MKVLIDMNLSPKWKQVMVDAGIDAKHWVEIGSRQAPDTEIADHAAENGFVVLTHDLDFGTLLATTGSRRPSVVQIRSIDVSPTTIGPSVIAALRQTSDELRDGALVTVDVNRARVRLLPLMR